MPIPITKQVYLSCDQKRVPIDCLSSTHIPTHTHIYTVDKYTSWPNFTVASPSMWTFAELALLPLTITIQTVPEVQKRRIRGNRDSSQLISESNKHKHIRLISSWQGHRYRQYLLLLASRLVNCTRSGWKTIYFGLRKFRFAKCQVFHAPLPLTVLRTIFCH